MSKEAIASRTPESSIPIEHAGMEHAVIEHAGIWNHRDRKELESVQVFELEC